MPFDGSDMNRTRYRIFLAAVLAFGALCFIIPVSGVLRHISAFIAIYYAPGLFFLLAAGNARRPALDVVFFPLILSPVLVSLALILLAWAGLDLHTSTIICGIVFTILALSMIPASRGAPDDALSVSRLVVAASAGFAAIIVVSYISNRFLIIRSDAWFHGCVVRDILARGIPPMEPGFPDVPIRYMWVYHAFNAAWMHVSRLPVFPALAVFNVVNAFAFPYLVARLAAVFFPERRFIIAAVALAIMGLESATWILWPLNLTRAFGGEVSGAAEVARIARSVQFNNARVIDALRLHWTWMVNTPDKHFTITAFSYALNLFIYAFLAARDVAFGERSPIRRFLFLFVPMLGALLFHVIVGTALVASAMGAALLALAARAIRKSDLVPRREIIVLLGASVCALAGGIPYLRSLVGGGPGAIGLGSFFHFGLKNILTIALPLLVLYPASKNALRALMTPEGLDGRMLLLWLAPLGALNILANLPVVNESKLVFPFFLLIAPFIARGLVIWFERARKNRRALVVVWFATLFAVPFLLTVRGFILDAPRDYCEHKRRDVTEQERELYTWIGSHTPVRASIILRSACTLMPVYADRRSFVPNRETINVNGYAGPKVDLYTRVHADLFSGDPNLGAVIDALAGTGNDYFLVLWSEDREAALPLVRLLEKYPGAFEKTFENRAGVVYAIRTSEHREGADHR
jgi:hypothetical protein